MSKLRWCLPTMILALLVSAAPGFAADRYVGPPGLITGTCSTVGSGCTFKYAAESAANFDHVIVRNAGSPYTVSAAVIVNASDLVIEGESGGRPTLDFGATDKSFIVNGGAARAKLSNLRFKTSDSTLWAFQFGPATVADGFEAYSTGTAPVLVMGDASNVLRNSVVHSTLSSIVVRANGQLRNSTILSEAAAGPASHFGAVLFDNNFSPAGSLTVRNTLIRSNGTDLRVDNTSGFPALVYFNADYSNFADSATEGPALASGATFGPHNQSSTPLLVDITGTYLSNNLHQTSSSPTRDAGINEALNGDFDFDGDIRCLGSAPDIGADEYIVAGLCPPPPPPPTANGSSIDILKPVVSALKAIKKKGKLKSLTFNVSEAGTATFKYTKKKGKKYKAAGSQTKAAKAGKNTVKPKKLKKGSYKLTLTVKDAAGNASASKKLSFKVK